MTQPRPVQLVPPPVERHQRRTWANWRDAMTTWPSLNITLRVFPWQWRVWFWNDWDCSPSWVMELGPIKIDCSANRPMFILDA